MESRTYKFNNSTVKIIFGDLISSKTDVMVISGSIGIPMLGGLPEYIKKHAGKSTFDDASKHSDAKLGDVVVTSAGDLPHKYLFHAVTVDFWKKVIPNIEEENLNGAYQYIISHVYRKCIRLLTAMELDSIAFPCLGVGMGNMPLRAVAKATAEIISQLLLRTNKKIRVEIYIKDTYGVYENLNYLPFFEYFGAYEILAKTELKPSDNDALQIAELNIPSIDIHDYQDVFISYSRKDMEAAKLICSLLNKIKLSFWIDVNGVYSGNNYKEEIVKAIQHSKIMIFLSSENSNKSVNVIKEINLADKYNKIIIPVRLDRYPMDPAIEYDLSSIDCIEMQSFDQSSMTKLQNAIIGQLAINGNIK